MWENKNVGQSLGRDRNSSPRFVSAKFTFYEADRPQFDWFLILGRVTPAERERVSVSMRLPQ